MRCADGMLRQFGPQELTNTAWALSQMHRAGVHFTPDVEVGGVPGGGWGLPHCIHHHSYRSLQQLAVTNDLPAPMTPGPAGPYPGRAGAPVWRPLLALARQAADHQQPGQRVR